MKCIKQQQWLGLTVLGMLAVMMVGCSNTKKVRISTDPAGAQVMIYRNPIEGPRTTVPGGTTPLDKELDFSDAKDYELIFSKDGYEGRGTIAWDPAEKLDYTFKLKAFKEVEIQTSPAGAEITLLTVEGSKILSKVKLGTTPLTKKLYFPNGRSYRFVASRKQYADAESTIEFQPISRKRYDLSMKQITTDLLDLSYKPVQTDRGIKMMLVVGDARSYFDTSEKGVNARSATRMTRNDDPIRQIGGPVLSPIEDMFVYSMTELSDRKPTIYTVVSGDTLESIADKFEVSVPLLKAWNRLGDEPLKRDQKIKVGGFRAYSNIWKQMTTSQAKTQVTKGKNKDLFPAFTRDGKMLVFSSDRIGDSTLWRVSINGGPLTRVTSSQARDYHSSISPDAMVYYESCPPNSEDMQIWSKPMGREELTQLRIGEMPRVSPDGRWVMYLRRDEDSDKRQIWRMKPDASGETQLTTNSEYDVTDPHWSPDGQWIVYASNEAKDQKGLPNWDIWLMSADGTKKTRLTTNGSVDDKPIWDRKGRSIYFRSNRGGAWNIWRIDPILPE